VKHAQSFGSWSHLPFRTIRGRICGGMGDSHTTGAGMVQGTKTPARSSAPRSTAAIATSGMRIEPMPHLIFGQNVIRQGAFR
jgi:hypothetical protein